MFEFYLRPSKIWRHLTAGIFPFRDLLYGFYVLMDNYSNFVLDWMKWVCAGCPKESGTGDNAGLAERQ